MFGRIITLCGSTSFKNDFIRMNKELTMQGQIVLSVGLFGHADQIPLTPEEKQMLDDLHKRKIDLSEEIFVINRYGYIGTSTRSEIDYALAKGKSVRYMEPIDTKK